jgi:V8-like Glu-specific endopeptidase
MYLKRWTQANAQALVRKYTDERRRTPSPAAGDMARSRPPMAATMTSSYNSSWNSSSPVPFPASSNASAAGAPPPAVGGGSGRRLLTHALKFIRGQQDDRWEVTQPYWPYTAVSLLEIDSMGYCSGTMIGRTGRLFLTAAHCLFDFDQNSGRPVGWYSNLMVAPGFYRGANAPYGWHPGAMAEVRASWMRKVRYIYCSTDQLGSGLEQVMYVASSGAGTGAGMYGR